MWIFNNRILPPCWVTKSDGNYLHRFGYYWASLTIQRIPCLALRFSLNNLSSQHCSLVWGTSIQTPLFLISLQTSGGSEVFMYFYQRQSIIHSCVYHLAHNPDCLNGTAHKLWVILALSGVEKSIYETEVCLVSNIAREQSRHILKSC